MRKRKASKEKNKEGAESWKLIGISEKTSYQWDHTSTRLETESHSISIKEASVVSSGFREDNSMISSGRGHLPSLYHVPNYMASHLKRYLG